MKRSRLKRKTPLRAKKQAPRRVKRTTQPKRRKPSIRLLKSKLWNECKRIIRTRYGNGDGTFSCYTCGAHLDEPRKAQTGHFIPSSICSVHMRYHLDNLKIQCYRCNINLSGNWIEYEKHLKADGIDPDELKKENEETKNRQYDRLWYEAKIAEYQQIKD